MYHPFSVTQTLSIAWHILKKNFATIAVYTLVAFTIMIGTSFLTKFILGDLIFFAIGVIVTILIISFSFFRVYKTCFSADR